MLKKDLALPENVAKSCVLVTGASGFLGRHVARLLAGRGDRVVGIGHGSWARAESEAWGVATWHNCDITLDTLRQFAGAPATIFHCAGGGSVPFSLTHPLQDFERAVVTTAHVMEFARTLPEPSVVVYPSSASVYGAANRERLYETDALTPMSPYGEHKAMAERIVALYARQFGMRCAVARLFSVYGPGQCKQLLWDACGKLAAGTFEFFGTGDEVRDWVHVDDAAAFMLLAAAQATRECPVANVAGGEGLTVRQVLTVLGRSLLGTEVALQFSGKPRPGDPDRFVADVSTAHGMGWGPRHGWRDGLAEYAAWWRMQDEKRRSV